MADQREAGSGKRFKFGPPAHPPRDGDRKQARRRINVEVREGRRVHPNTLPCASCGHVWSPGERRHEYHHHLGYAAEHHYAVEPLCTACHAAESTAGITHCPHGHEYTPENQIVNSRGHRRCRTCAHERDRARRPAGYWRERRARKKAAGPTIDGQVHDAFPEAR